METTPLVSVIIPIYNEEKYIASCLDSVLHQDFDKTQMEVILVDGLSTDKTRGIISAYIDQYPDLFQLLDNPKRTVQYGVNIGIRASTGNYLVRLDAHSEFPPEYLSKCVSYLELTDADNVGGVAVTKGSGLIGSAIALLMSSPFGVGNSSFRVGHYSGETDTVPFGAFRRTTFERYGLFNEKLTRNEDNEINYRIRKRGGKVYLASDISFVYHCRDTIGELIKMAFQNGKWNLITFFLCPGAMSIRHFIPFLFVLSLILLPAFIGVFGVVFQFLFYLEIGLYGMLDIVFSAGLAAKSRWANFFLLFILFPIFHISYGLGSMAGLVLYPFKKF